MMTVDAPAPRDPDLTQRWLALWRASGAAGDPHPDLDDLLTRWSEPHRAYHGLAHLRHCLEELDTARDLAHDAPVVELALWYHDVVHEPLAKDNEERSADLADAAATRMGLAPARRAFLRAFILATTHQASPAPGDEALVVDIDLAILGQPPERFDAYEREIRQEYRLVPEPLFRDGRARILKALLDRPQLYATDEFRARYEAAARENLARALAS